MNTSIVIADRSGRFAILSGICDNESEWQEAWNNEFVHTHFDRLSLAIINNSTKYKYVYHISDCKGLYMQLRNTDLDVEYTEVISLEQLFDELADWDDIEINIISENIKEFDVDINGNVIKFSISRHTGMYGYRYKLTVYMN